MNWTRKTAPTVPAIDLGTAKRQCRVEDTVSDDDALLEAYVSAATAWVESYTGRCLRQQTWQVSLHYFPTRLWLPMGAPNVSVVSVKYYDTSNVQQTLSTSVYSLVAFSEPGYIELVDAQTWPSVWERDDAVQVEYTAGMTAAQDIEPALAQAVQLLVGHWYANREEVVVGTSVVPVPMAAEALCAPYRLFIRGPEW